MPKRCQRCQKYHDLEGLYCEDCKEILRERLKEKEEIWTCLHCKQSFTTKGGIDRHIWNCYYQFGYRPKVIKTKR